MWLPWLSQTLKDMTISRKKGCLILLASAAAFSALGQTATSTNAAPATITSVFIMPSSPQEGRDPFYPESSRPYITAVAHKLLPVVDLTIHGFSGTADDRTVIINNHSFGVGDEGDVITPGGRAHLRVLAITTNSVVIECDHQRRELTFSTQ
jgi:hypothetical protein